MAGQAAVMNRISEESRAETGEKVDSRYKGSVGKLAMSVRCVVDRKAWVVNVAGLSANLAAQLLCWRLKSSLRSSQKVLL